MEFETVQILMKSLLRAIFFGLIIYILVLKSDLVKNEAYFKLHCAHVKKLTIDKTNPLNNHLLKEIDILCGLERFK